MALASGRGEMRRSACWLPGAIPNGRRQISISLSFRPIEAHSKKPDEARDKIVALMGDLPRVELFARQSPPGWEVWGNEVKSTIPDFGTKCPEVKGAGKEADPCPM